MCDYFQNSWMSSNTGQNATETNAINGEEPTSSNQQPQTSSSANNHNISPPNQSNVEASGSTSATSTPLLASALDPFIANVTSRQNTHGGSTSSLKHIAEYLRKTDDLLFDNLQKLDQVLTLLNTGAHSLAIAQVLWVKLSSVPLDADLVNTVEPLIVQTISFMKEAHYSDFEVHGLDIFSRMCKAFANLLIARDRAQLGIQPLRNVIKLLRREGELINIMTTFLLLCLRSNNFKPATEILDVDIVEIRHEGNKIEVADILLYFYYGGLCYLAIKHFTRANLFFEITVSTPATQISKIMVEAYKKYLLTSFILYGKVKSSPVKSSPSANIFLKSVRGSTQAYSDVVECKTVSELKDSLSRNENLYKDDGNYGLVKQCIVSMYKRNIQKLTKTFLTLSLTDITNTVNLDRVSQTEKYVTEMVNEGQIQARINHEQGMVYFLDQRESANGEQALSKLSEQIAKCVEINAKFCELDDSMKTSAQYQEKLQRTTSQGDSSHWDYASVLG
ncbi:COP9 signalosome complex subunit 3-like [Convolutriloba macropyga]|uniref:COP9 signalosome complex subunit 3-like n=1 Tax=Convolutriloba macropyga TaxID=536237 RepID=UPI003F52140B